MRRGAFLVVALVVLAGCAGPVADSQAGDRSTATTERPRTDPSDLSTRSDTTALPSTETTATPPAPETAGERAIAAEKARIRNVTSAWPNLTDLSFGILRPADYEVHRRDASGVVVDVTVGYSTSFTCGLSVDGAATEARYVVTADTVRLVEIDQDVGDPPRACRSPSPDDA